MENLIGQTLGQYRIVEQIGQGGMATVYKAYQPSLDRYVAVKVLPPYFAHSPGFAERFIREAKAVAKLGHPNILPIHDFGQEGGLSYIVMKYVPAGALKDKMGRPMPLEEMARLIESIAAALDHAHERGILHRDVKPGNVLLDEGDWVLLTDFGLAKMIAGDETLTATGVGIGTPAYTSPEQGQGMEVDVRTDVYSLGVVLYEIATGQLPFDAETPLAIVMKHITAPLPLPSSIRPDLPDAVERVILKALAKAPDDRFATTGELSRALNSALVGSVVPIETPEETLARLPGLYTQALGYFYTEQWARAAETLETIVAVQPDYENGEAARRLERAREQLRLADLYTRSQATLADEEWATAIACLDEITVLDASFRDAKTLLEQARRQKELADLYHDAKRLHDSEQWQAAINVWERIHALDADYADPDGLLALARAGQETRRLAEEQAHRLADLYRRGLKHVAADEWETAATLFAEIESLQPGYQETAGLLERAQREMARPEAARATEPEIEKEATTSLPPQAAPAPPPAPEEELTLIEQDKKASKAVGVASPKSETERQLAPPRRRVPGWAWALGGLAALAVVAVLVAALSRGGTQPEPTVAVAVAEATDTPRPTATNTTTHTPQPTRTPTDTLRPTGTRTSTPQPTSTPRTTDIISLEHADKVALVRTLYSTGFVESVTFNPESSLLAWSGNGGIWVYDMRADRKIAHWSGHTAQVHSVRFGYPGVFLISGGVDTGGGRVRFWDDEYAEIRSVRVGPPEWGVDIDFSPDNKLLATHSAFKFQVWDAQDMRSLWDKSLTGGIPAFSPDGERVACVTEYGEALTFYDAATDEVLDSWQIPGQGLYEYIAPVFSPSGEFIAAAARDNTVRVFLADGSVRTLEGHTQLVESVAFSPDGEMLASGSQDSTVRLWRVSDGEFLRTLEGHTNWVHSVAFSPDGQTLASGSSDGTVRLWGVAP